MSGARDFPRLTPRNHRVPGAAKGRTDPLKALPG